MGRYGRSVNYKEAAYNDGTTGSGEAWVPGDVFVRFAGRYEADVAREIKKYLASRPELHNLVASVGVRRGKTFETAWHTGGKDGDSNADMTNHVTFDMWDCRGNYIATNHVNDQGYGTRIRPSAERLNPTRRPDGHDQQGRGPNDIGGAARGGPGQANGGTPAPPAKSNWRDNSKSKAPWAKKKDGAQ